MEQSPWRMGQGRAGTCPDSCTTVLLRGSYRRGGGTLDPQASGLGPVLCCAGKKTEFGLKKPQSLVPQFLHL